MSRDRYRKNNANNHENCVIEEKLSFHDKAIRAKHINDRKEVTLQHVVIKVDPKTTIYKSVPADYEPKETDIMHKGKI